ncbi:hypothetical protein B0H66DRAFT_608671 [Apodospora peruviana]|uniref:Gamma interferon inducible lysosomal thiol reductase n=1 Tax=Apodospora peruviana TaxID=516989 RepID=A0AAE0HT66_9PEZI|nr:hypothetical protein B0H66DRAFT_608671 [Apodospora peruviana]
MDEKRAFEQLPITQGSDSGSRQPADDSNRRHHHSRRPLHFLTIATLILSLWAFYRATTSSSRRWQERPLIWGKPYPSHLKGVATTPNIKLDENTLVPFEAHIMSKCPDAKDCLELMVLPAMQRVHDKVNFTLSYIGRPTANDGVACKHGPEECLGNIIELCAQKLYPDPKTYLGFTMCMTKQYSHIPQRSLVEDCALEHALDFNELNNCATEDDGAVGMGAPTRA